MTVGEAGPTRVEIRCKACTVRFGVPSMQLYAECPQCHQAWKIKWFAPDAGMIIAPVGWAQYQEKSRRIGDS